MEAADIKKDAPICVTTGGLKVMVVSPGTYRFYGDTAELLDGKLQTADQSLTIKKGQQITSVAGLYEQSRIPSSAQLDSFDVWSRQRSSASARANALARNGYSSGGSHTNNALWVLALQLGLEWLYVLPRP
jgi:hypothetical protein